MASTQLSLHHLVRCPGSFQNQGPTLTHGENDTMIPVDWARASRDQLQKLKVDLDYHEFRMGHNVSIESLSVIATWLKKQLGL